MTIHAVKSPAARASTGLWHSAWMAAARALSAAFVAATLAACSGGSGEGETANPQPPINASANAAFIYAGPPARDNDVVRFQQNFYNNLVADNRCGSCHTRGGTGTGAFVDRTDINVAYDAALAIVNLPNPIASRVVDKVGGGHNCWTTPAACRVLLTSYIENWAASAAGGAVTVRFTSPVDRDPNGAGGGFRAFPATPPAAYSGVHNVLTNFCAGCHTSDAPTPQQPYFAAADFAVSYAAVQPKIDLNTTTRSRLFLRLRDEHHNCWTDCAANAQTMLSAIDALAGTVAPRVLDAAAFRSAGQFLNDGIIGSSGGRFEQYQIALWQFKEGSGDRISDTSGVAPDIELSLRGTEGEGLDYQWVSGWGMQFTGRAGIASGNVVASRKLYNLIAPGGEYSLEAWVAPANVTQDGPAEIFSYGEGNNRRNFLLGQTMYNYEFFNRSSRSTIDGGPSLSTDDADERAQASLQHVVMTFSQTAGRRIYVNGDYTGDADPLQAGTLAADWSPDYSVFLGGDTASAVPWAGVVKMISVHNRVLSDSQVQLNYSKGAGEKRYLLFNISHTPGVPSGCVSGTTSNCYIVFEVSQFDNYSYLFNKPTFISLDPNFVPYNMTIKGIRVGINGQLATVGQAYIAVNSTINAIDYRAGNSPDSGQLLYDRGTIVTRENGPDTDLFYIEFDQIGGSADRTGVFVPPTPAFAYTLDGEPGINAGWRVFDSVSYAFAQLTGVPPASNDAASTRVLDQVFASARQSLPAISDFQSFLASHHTAIGQLSIAYCSTLMNDAALRTSFFGVNGTPAGFKADLQGNLVTPLATRFVGGGLSTQPSVATVVSELMATATNAAPGRNPGMATTCAGGTIAGCSDTRTLEIATALCAGALGSAAISAQ
jgi:Concanavalin A-like lectin/glucanases superfamily